MKRGAKDRSSYFYTEVARFERSLLESALNQCHWNRCKAAIFLGISYRSMIYKIQEHNLFSPAEKQRVLTNAERFGVSA